MMVSSGGPAVALVVWTLVQVAMFLVGTALVLLWAVRTSRPSGGVPAPITDSREAALAVLRHRLAGGEIEPADFEARRRLLEEGVGG